MIGPTSGVDNNLQRAYRVALLINVSMLLTLGTYAVVVEVLKGSIQHVEPMAAVGLLKNVFFVMGLALFFVVKFMGGVLLGNSRTDTREERIGRLQRCAVFTAVLCEVPGVLGLVLFIVGGERVDFYILMAMSVGLYAAFFPRLSKWRRWAGTGDPAPAV